VQTALQVPASQYVCLGHGHAFHMKLGMLVPEPFHMKLGMLVPGHAASTNLLSALKV
jgi:hypothetical protein